jgi:drug/metabolite transporter (DMT)-like permease
MLAFGAGLGLFFVGRQERFATAPNPALGNLLAATCGLTWAITVMGLRWMAKRGASPEAAVVSGNVTVFLATLPLALPYGSHSVADWGIILYLGVFQIALAYVLLTAAVAHLPAFEVTLLLFLEPALNPVWSWLVHGEHPGSWALVGGVVILGATATQAMIARRREAAT